MNGYTASTFDSVEQASAWYLVHCKPRQDQRAEENLLRQGYGCFRPQHSCERIVRGRRQTVVESLFPGYLFIQLAINASWAPLRSTRGVNRVVGFGNMPLPLDNGLIAHLQQRTVTSVKPAFEVGDRVRITAGGFAELDAIFMAMEGEQRVILLLDMLNRQQQISVPLVSIVKN
nr:transcription/translation regulatory transformer protein RfaH [uncultured Pseudomonas sp.]